MLVLLIIMMIVAPMLQKGANVTLPKAANTADKPETSDQVVIAITADGGFWLNGLRVPDSDLRRRTEESLEGKKERIILIKADEDAKYEKVMEAMDEMRAIGIEDMGLITDPKTSSSQAGGN
jgi:biopolymer transport protein ExbD